MCLLIGSTPILQTHSKLVRQLMASTTLRRLSALNQWPAAKSLRGVQRQCLLKTAVEHGRRCTSPSYQMSGTHRALRCVEAATGSTTSLALPPVGLGTWKSRGDDVKHAVVESLRLGYPLVDCAEVYGNEALVGAAFDEVFNSSGEHDVKREDVWIVSKVFNNYHGRSAINTVHFQTPV